MNPQAREGAESWSETDTMKIESQAMTLKVWNPSSVSRDDVALADFHDFLRIEYE